VRIALVDPVATTPSLSPRAFIAPTVAPLADSQSVRRTNLVELGRTFSEMGHPTTVVLGDVYLAGRRWDLSSNLAVVPVRTALRVPFHPGLVPFTPSLEHHPSLQDADIIQTGEFHQPSTYYGCRLARRRGVPIVVWQETFGPMRFPGSLYQGAFERTAGKLVLAEVRRYIPRTTKATAYLRALRVAEDRIAPWIPTGIDTEAFAPRKSSYSPQDFGWPGDSTVLLLVSRLNRGKGVNLALHVLRAVVRDSPRARLLVAGSGTELDALRRLSADLGVLDHVRFLGQVSREVLPPLYNFADIVLSTSRNDLLPFTLIEAGACGRPCVAFDVGAVGDIVKNGETGYVLEPPDIDSVARKVRILADDPDERARLGGAARDRIAMTFDLRRVARGFLEVYRGVGA